MAKKEFVKLSIGEEATVGTSAAVTARVPITDVSVLAEDVTKSETGIIVGRRTEAGSTLDSVGYSQEIPTVLTANKANWMLFKSLMGVRGTPVPCVGSIAIHYKGSAESCILTIGADKITAKAGALGSESAIEGFSVSLAGTIASIVSAVNAVEGFEAKKMNGSDTASATGACRPISAQAAGAAVPVPLKGATSKAYCTVFTPNYGEGENSTVSLLTEGVGDNVLAVGCAANTMSLSAELKGKATLSYSMVGLKKQIGQGASGLAYSESDLNPMKFNDGLTYIDGVAFSYVKSQSLEVNNNIADDEGWEQGTLYKSEHAQGKFQVSGSITLKLTPADADASSEKLSRKVASDEESALLLEYKGCAIESGLDEECIFQMPKIQYTSGSKSAGTNWLQQELNFSAVDDAELVGDVLTIYMIGKVSG